MSDSNNMNSSKQNISSNNNIVPSTAHGYAKEHYDAYDFFKNVHEFQYQDFEDSSVKIDHANLHY